MRVSLHCGYGVHPESPNKSWRIFSPIAFASIAIGPGLCSPILSLIDTSAVGLLAGTIHQAALSPAVAVTDYSALLLAFMYTGTTNLVAASRESDKGDPTKPRTAKTLITSLRLSFYIGTVFATTLLLLSKTLLKAILGNDSIDPYVFDTALKYVRIRALGMPAATVIGSAQAACMGMQDVRSPLYVLFAAAIVNFFGNVLFVGSKHPWVGGAPGAAWATVFSQYAAVGLFLKWLASRPPSPKKKEATMKGANNIIKSNHKITSDSGKTSSEIVRDAVAYQMKKIRVGTKSNATKKLASAVTKMSNSRVVTKLKQFRNTAKAESAEEFFSSRGFLHGRFRKRSLFHLPNLETSLMFLPYVLPIAITSIGRVSSYVAMSHVVSSSLGTIAMAAQQVIVSIFYCLCPVADALNLTAQSFIPGIYEKERGSERTAALRKTSKEFLQAGGIFGAVLVGIASLMPFMCPFFTSDPVVIGQVKQIVPFLAGAFAVHGAICASEGVLLGQKDLGFLGKAYAAFFLAVPMMMLRVKQAALAGAGVGLTSVWRVFVGYQILRSALFLTRVRVLAHNNND